ncbi:ABC transporter ATP-binding protein [Roseomonas gilardii]|uniref:ABC transporter ATP-binding protein n=1 Tax=Roseomonas gilardii TaxID=257708 RepID=UPI0004B29925|nr:ABC transporter ATP-binding protein [Roseomonas gilardii]SUE62640.1 Glutathione import ATP-binding protein GsiA [Roseomonas gilardii subsp. rosea]
MDCLEIRDLSVALPPGADRPYALQDVTLTLEKGKILCVVGESGSGKSMTASAVMRLLPEGVRVAAGQVLLAGEDLLAKSEAEMRRLRGARIAMIFQEPMTALNPLRSIGDQIGESFRIHTGLDAAEIERRVLALLEEVRIPDPQRALKAYPHELSGGQRQRAMIAMALALEPEVLIADEPTTALDVTTQAQILSLIRDLQAKHGTAVLFITHDFGVVAEIADRIAVMRQGVVVEQGEAGDILNRPEHPYTRALIAAVPPLHPTAPEAPPLRAGPALMVRGVSKTYGKAGLFRRNRRIVKALDDVGVSLPKGGTLGIVGESGSGKSTLARCVVRLLDPDEGSIRLGGTDLAKLSAREMRAETKRIQMVFQDPFASLNPRRKVGELVAQGPMVHGTPRAEAMARARDLFELVGLRPDAMDRFPHEFSGGQRQRIGLARALALRPEVLVADEAVSALDVSVQAQVLRLLAELRQRLGLSVLFITHDLRVAAQICDRIAVMHRGRVVEEGTAVQVFGDPRHDYTKSLLASVPGRGWTPPSGLAPVPEEIA